MRMRNPKDKDEILSNCDFYYDNNKFKNNNRVALEVGMGKGDFIVGMAKAYPDVNFIGMEKYSSVASVAIKKIKENNLDNVRVLVMDVVNSAELLKETIDVIYLNFSDPWPKDRHAKRRLTHANQLKVYDQLFSGTKEIFMKTDNLNLFDFSLDSLIDYGYKILDKSYDLHALDYFNVLTEYEEKFSKKGDTIKFLHASKKD